MDIGTIITTYDIAVTDAAGRTSWGGEGGGGGRG